MSQPSSESEESFEHVGSDDSVLSLDSWNIPGDPSRNTATSENRETEQRNEVLAERFGSLVLGDFGGDDGDDDGSSFASFVDVLRDTLAATSLENLPSPNSDPPANHERTQTTVNALPAGAPEADPPVPAAASTEAASSGADGQEPGEVTSGGGGDPAVQPPVRPTRRPWGAAPRSNESNNQGTRESRPVSCGQRTAWTDRGSLVAASSPAGNNCRTAAGADAGRWHQGHHTWGDCALGAGDGPLAAVFAPPPDEIVFRGNFEQAMALAKDEKKLLLVSLQDYDGPNAFGSHAVNRDIFSLEQFRGVAPDRYIFIQISIETKEAREYARHFQVEHFPHLGILHPVHRSMLWGVDGWSAEQPWEPGRVMEALVDWGFGRYTERHHEMMEEDPEEEFAIDPIEDVNQEYLTQEAAVGGMDVDMDDPEQVENFFLLQEAMLSS